MKMDDKELKRLLQDGMEYEADCIMNEVNSDPDLKDVVAPKEIHDKLFQQIREYEEATEKKRNESPQEDGGLIRVGKTYKKKKGRSKYYILLVAAVICAVGIGTVSVGDGKNVFSEIQNKFGSVEHKRISEQEDERFEKINGVSEEDAYEEINEKFGFYPVRLTGLPEGMRFAEYVIDENAQNVRLYYSGENETSILYSVTTNYREGSWGIDVEDELIKEYDKKVEGTNISIKEYYIKENKTSRWTVDFIYKDEQYSIMLIGIDENDVEKIVENLYFS